MKKIFILIISFIIVSCSNDSDGSFSTEGSGQGGSLARFIIVDNYLYTVDDQSLRIFDVSSDTTPIYLSEQFIGFDIETIYSYGEYLYMGSRLGMYIYDISNRENPIELSEVLHVRSCDPVVSNGDYSFVTLHTNINCEGFVNQLEVYDTRDPEQPILINVTQMPRPIGLGLYGNYLFVADLNAVRIFDVSTPSNPTHVNMIPTEGFDVIIRDDQILVIGETNLKQYQLNPNNLQDITELSTITF